MRWNFAEIKTKNFQEDAEGRKSKALESIILKTGNKNAELSARNIGRCDDSTYK